ncbi:MAG TPA: type II toxin-antitoxin system ParD family antitoxin [Hyphomonas sp.]|nr:type II toxin-antitoxin system ParD family antitoxin [Hyphomonas sp.]HRJ01977.1 type II toxin-antitoxin system ParD family antitoxin [Hyphomonas sp.]HRK68139.1 type II toxin-antitoxin system ParD family antitoxin [Hyphomonas sp.]
MATMNISLPDQMKAWVEAQSADGKYANSSDLIRDLIRREQIKQEKIAALNEKIEEAYASGFIEVDDIPAFFENIRKSARP